MYVLIGPRWMGGVAANEASQGMHWFSCVPGSVCSLVSVETNAVQPLVLRLDRGIKGWHDLYPTKEAIRAMMNRPALSGEQFLVTQGETVIKCHSPCTADCAQCTAHRTHEIAFALANADNDQPARC